MKCEILYEDAELLVIRKPAGLATEAAGMLQPDVVSFLKNELHTDYVGLVHRLDQPVEGLLVVGKTKAAAAALSKELSDGRLRKSYQALGHDEGFGEYLDTSASQKDPVKVEAGFRFQLNDRIAKDPKTKKAVVADGPGKGMSGAGKSTGACAAGKNPTGGLVFKEAGLSGEVLKKETHDILRLRIEISTGRFHQIRSQLSHAHCPLIGDLKYGSKESLQVSSQLGIGRLCLCADRLSFVHPKSGKTMEFQIYDEPEGLWPIRS